MAKQIQWTEGRYAGHTGRIDMRGTKVAVASIDWAVSGDAKWVLRMTLPGFSRTTRKHNDLEDAKAQAQRIFDNFAKEIS